VPGASLAELLARPEPSDREAVVNEVLQVLKKAQSHYEEIGEAGKPTL
jgi:hypothetical protein